MQVRTVIHLDREDAANPNDMLHAANLVGVESKEFARIRGNEFSLEDVYIAVDIIRDRRNELCIQKPVFSDPKINDDWFSGIRASADHAVRLAEQFLSDLTEQS